MRRVVTASPSILIVAGEASADMHGARVMHALRAARPDLLVFGAGGEAMRAEGLDSVCRAEDISVAGLTEVVFAIPRLLGVLKRLAEQARLRRPRAAVLIDLPDFNLRLAARLKRLGVPVVYFISPQVWAWRQGRVHEIRRLVDKMLVILPFEQAFYRQHGVDAEFVGHPLVEQLPEGASRAEARCALALPDDGAPLVALLPGSRHKEITRHLPLMLAGVAEARRSVPNLRAVIPIASTIPRALIERCVAKAGVTATLIDGRATEVLIAADAAVVCSGTATLQTALLLRPMVVVYRVSWLTYQILKRMVKVAYITLVNLIAGRGVVTELIQREFTPAAVARELLRLLSSESARTTMTADFAAIRHELGGKGAALRVAEVVLDYVTADGAAPTAKSTLSQERGA